MAHIPLEYNTLVIVSSHPHLAQLTDAFPPLKFLNRNTTGKLKEANSMQLE